MTNFSDTPGSAYSAKKEMEDLRREIASLMRKVLSDCEDREYYVARSKFLWDRLSNLSWAYKKGWIEGYLEGLREACEKGDQSDEAK